MALNRAQAYQKSLSADISGSRAVNRPNNKLFYNHSVAIFTCVIIASKNSFLPVNL